MWFFEYSIGLYVHEVNLNSSISDNKLVNSNYLYSFLQTLEDNKSNFTKRQIKQAKESRILYTINNNFIQDCKDSTSHLRPR